MVERFYTPLGLNDFQPPGRTQLVDAIAADRGAGARKTLLAILQHRDFAAVDGLTLMQVCLAINAWVDPDVVPWEELRELSHPLGLSALRTPEEIAAAEKQHPLATRNYLARLQEWRERVHKSRPSWAPADGK